MLVLLAPALRADTLRAGFSTQDDAPGFLVADIDLEWTFGPGVELGFGTYLVQRGGRRPHETYAWAGWSNPSGNLTLRAGVTQPAYDAVVRSALEDVFPIAALDARRTWLAAATTDAMSGLGVPYGVSAQMQGGFGTIDLSFAADRGNNRSDLGLAWQGPEAPLRLAAAVDRVGPRGGLSFKAGLVLETAPGAEIALSAFAPSADQPAAFEGLYSMDLAPSVAARALLRVEENRDHLLWGLGADYDLVAAPTLSGAVGRGHDGETLLALWLGLDF